MRALYAKEKSRNVGKLRPSVKGIRGEVSKLNAARGSVMRERLRVFRKPNNVRVAQTLAILRLRGHCRQDDMGNRKLPYILTAAIIFPILRL